ncbi:hypothetical protein F4815DRAFT_361741 [Daldinia loculata]|uniref:uncharacterized protein n=1 Tax=Daldinia loculata TaxID=103429 RepID=UPI0020C28BAA|nr:uncharacterized protein F4817DRAFT_316634 [Daldinia loculata]KAI1646633.1 hypothetical protein F4817DRAFT_316634 [Daldinia loculata]KAI2776305.1 hypothetical protein F4815DRAFT_361741 [Daldinia loculata]
MCYFAVTTFSCGCLAWRGSEYRYCAERGRSCRGKQLEKYEWLTYCPDARKALDNRKCKNRVVLPKCCERLSQEQRDALCTECNSILENGKLDLFPYCAEHRVRVSAGIEADAEKEFEKVVALWPSHLRSRYLRRKQDKTARDCGWSL